MDYLEASKDKDPQLWYIARKRASFKRNLAAYLVMVAVFWIIWYLTGGSTYDDGGVPWPVWPMLGWGIGVAFHYIGAYVAHKSNDTQKEYDKLVEQQAKQ